MSNRTVSHIFILKFEISNLIMVVHNPPFLSYSSGLLMAILVQLKHAALLYLILQWPCATLRWIIFCCTGMFMWILPGLWLFHSYTICTTTSKHSTAVCLCVNTADDRQYFMKVQYQRHKTHSYQHDFQISVTKICDNTITGTVILVAALVYDAQAQIQNNISCSGQQHAGREQKLVSQMFPNNPLYVPVCWIMFSVFPTNYTTHYVHFSVQHL